jgi:sugar lactone lactonase YvrE
LQIFLIILLIRKDQTGGAIEDGKKLSAFSGEISGKAGTCIAVVKSSRAHMIGRLLLIFVIATPIFCSAEPASDAKSLARARLARVESLRKERPNDGVLIFYEAITRIELGDRDAAFALLGSLNGRKLGLVPVRDAGFEAVWDDPEFQKIRQKLAQGEGRTPDAPVAFHLTDPKLIPEGIAYNPKQDRFLIGSVAQKKIVRANRKGDVKDFSKPEDNLDCVLGLFVDAAHEQLYAVSTNGFLDEAQKQRRNAVVRYDLKNGLLVNRYDAPEANQLNDLTVSPDGTIYATDSASGRLFRKSPAEKMLTPFGPKSALPGANGITLGADGSLYVAISTGIARIDLSTGAPTRLPQPDTVVTGGCDGLYWHKGDLLGIQNVTNPGRVIRIALADQGKRISGVTVLQSHHHPEFSEPTTGTIDGNIFFVLANSYVGHLQPGGNIKNPEQLKPTVIVAVSTGSTQ